MIQDMLRFGLILALICLLAGGLLAGVNHLTKTKILAQNAIEQENSLKEVFPEAAFFEAVNSPATLLYYKALDTNKKLLGFAFIAQGKGYSSTIETLVGMRKDGAINAVRVTNLNETPGLGNRVAEKSFTGQFSNKEAGGLMGVEAITGATISSKAVMDSVKAKALEIIELTKNEK
jgi:electron transport complex protein RnfG